MNLGKDISPLCQITYFCSLILFQSGKIIMSFKSFGKSLVEVLNHGGNLLDR